ncbi:MAG: hypothetical protein ACO3GP_02100 [Candidatus Limnocylindrus sp.]
MVTLVNRAKMDTATTGTGTITLGSAVAGYQTFAAAGVTDGDVVRYVIEDGTAWEVGYGAYTASGTTLSRTVMESSNSDAAINLSGSAAVFIGAAAEDVPNGTAATAVTVSSGTYTLNLAENTVFHADNVATSTVALSNVPTSSSYAGRFKFSFMAQSLTWPAAFDWETEAAPTLTFGKDYVANFYVDDDNNANIKTKIDGPYAYTGGKTFPTFVDGTTASATNGGDVTIDLTNITGLAENDFVIVIGNRASSTTGVAPTTSSSGWTQLATGTSNNTNATGSTVWYKVMGATPDTSFVVQGSGGANDSTCGIVLAFRGLDATTKIDATTTSASATGTKFPTFTSITSSANDRVLILIGAAAAGTTGVLTYNIPADYDGGLENAGNDTHDSLTGMAYKIVYGQSEAFTPSNFTGSTSNEGSASVVNYTILLRGAS